MSNIAKNEERGRALVLTDAAGNLYLIPAEKIADSLIKETAISVVEKTIKGAKAGDDFKLLGTYEFGIEARRAAYARPRVSATMVESFAATA